MAETLQMAETPGTRTAKKMPTLLGADMGGMCEQLSGHCTANHRKNAVVHHYAGAIIAPGADNTKGIAVAAPTESGVLSRLNSGTRMHRGCYGFWQDGPYRKAGRTAIPVLSTSCAQNALDKAFAGFQSRIGANQMATSQSTSTPMQGNHQAYLEGRAQRSESWARESALRDAERNRETGRRLAAARKAKREAKAMEAGVLV